LALSAITFGLSACLTYQTALGELMSLLSTSKPGEHMTTYAEMTETATAQILSALRPFEEFAHALTDCAVDTISKLPSPPRLPGTDALPTQLELVTGYFTFAERLLHAQRDFAVRLASAADRPEKPTEG
jgi:hypothetical protein